jgi:hypothetical protein
MTDGERDIRNGLRRRWLTPDEALVLVDAELARVETPSLLVLRAVLVQLGDDPDLALDEARVSLERAIELAPDDPEAYEELGHFFDVVVPDRYRALRLYRLALAKGAGASCRDALEELLAE